jgi:flagellar basal-body rod modification protein FlgD
MAIPDIMSTAASTTPLHAEHAKRTDKRGSQDLGAEDFIKILTTQLTHQNPLEPMKDTEFIHQMSQFNELEQAREMSQTMKANTYLGRTVTLDTTVNGKSEEIKGDVTAYVKDKNGDKVEVQGLEYPVSSIKRVELPGKAPIPNPSA